MVAAVQLTQFGKVLSLYEYRS